MARVLCLDYEHCYEPAARATFGSMTSSLDFDVVIWDPAEALWQYRQGEDYLGLPCLTDNSSAAMMGDIERRRTEFRELLAVGRTLLIIVRTPQRFYYATGEQKVSGTGRNAQIRRVVAESDVLNAAPVALKLRPAKGTNLEFIGQSPLQQLWARHRQVLSYDAYLIDPPGIPQFRIAGTTHTTGALHREESGGVLVLLPAPDFPEVDVETDDEDITPSAGPFFRDLLDVIEQLRVDSSDVALPSWSDRYQLPGEAIKKDAVQRRANDLEEAKEALATAESALRELQQAKVLFTGTGRSLELAVRDAMEKLGGTVSEPPPGRDDWKVAFPEGELVVEVKGVKGSAAEKHAAQLEKWVAQHLADTGSPAKGLLLVNAWRDAPLSERTQPPFPDQMIPYSTARGHCLMTTTQLLATVLDATTTAKKKAARELLLSTSGVLDQYSDWHTYLTEEVTTEQDTTASPSVP